MSKPLPGRPAFDLHLPTVGGDKWRLADQTPENFLLILFYRGLHCPICRDSLQELQTKLGEFERRGVQVFAASCDSEARARKSVQDWGVDKLTIGYDLSIEEARAWDLYTSKAIKDGEPDEFSEPGMFLIRPDRTLYAAWIQSTPFARPQLDDVLSAVDYINKNDYPPRGTTE